MMRTTILTAILSITTTSIWAGGGWTQGKGNGFFMLSQRYIGGSFYADNNAHIIMNNEDWAGVFTTHFYAEYGLGKNMDIIFHSPFLTGSYYTNNPEQGSLLAPEKLNNWSFGDIDAALKYLLLSKNGINASATVILGLPSGKYKPGVFGNSEPLTGDGDFNQMLKIDVSGSFGKNLFASVFAGFNNRTSGFSDEIHLGGEIGHNGAKLVSILKVYFLNSFENGENAVSSIPGIYSNNLEYLSLSTCFLYKLDETKGFILDLGFAPYLRNIIAAPSFTFGFYLKR